MQKCNSTGTHGNTLPRDAELQLRLADSGGAGEGMENGAGRHFLAHTEEESSFCTKRKMLVGLDVICLFVGKNTCVPCGVIAGSLLLNYHDSNLTITGFKGPRPPPPYSLLFFIPHMSTPALQIIQTFTQRSHEAGKRLKLTKLQSAFPEVERKSVQRGRESFWWRDEKMEVERRGGGGVRLVGRSGVVPGIHLFPW